jgi:hypothetical protein
MPRAIHDALLEDSLAEQHHWVPDSGWITYRVTNASGLAHAIWLMRLSYLRYALKQSEEPQALFERETHALNLSHRFATLLANFVPAREQARGR